MRIVLGQIHDFFAHVLEHSHLIVDAQRQLSDVAVNNRDLVSDTRAVMGEGAYE